MQTELLKDGPLGEKTIIGLDEVWIFTVPDLRHSTALALIFVKKKKIGITSLTKQLKTPNRQTTSNCIVTLKK